MEAPAAGPLTLAEFEAELAASEWRLELIDGYVYAFAGGTVAHDVLTLHITRALQDAVRPPCRVYSSNMPIRRAAAPTYVFPDASVSCEPVEPATTKLVEPLAVVEVISTDSVRRDRIDKLDTYQAIPSLSEYVMLDSRRIWTCVYRRAGDAWSEHVRGSGETLTVTSVGSLSVNIDRLYEGTGLPRLG
ncbi:MAG: Uma2 family endonuclease [Candidatus Eremiobacteraeota bacterium]|nr:Uma2 family endonuclease [Candidatus Eremiobacteraeota bacterium]MBC5821754.1 Uma2 family endonuclease [Candidatus Eremiobacteraeota bacterium]